MPSAGGPAIQVTRGGGIIGEESWDGRYLYYAKPPDTGIWRLPIGGGEETEVIRGPIPGAADWALVRAGIYYDTVRRQGPRNEFTIQFFDFASRRTIQVFRQSGPSRYGSLAVSQDERWMLYGETPASQSELMLVENFR